MKKYAKISQTHSQCGNHNQNRPNKKGCVRVTGLNILVRVGTHVFLLFFFSEIKFIILCILKYILPFKVHKIIFFPENLKKIPGFASKFRLD